MSNIKNNNSITRIVLNMSVPAILESFFTSFAGLVDSYMVSSLGASSVAAVGLTTQPKFCALAIFFAISIALSALVARRLGQNERDKANGIFLTAIITILLLVILISFAGIVFASPILRLCGTTSDTHGDAVTYFTIIMSGLIFNSIQICINSAQRGAGNTKITMRTNVTSNIVNIIFNYILINGKFGFPKLGIRGAAIATVLGTVVGAIMSIASVMSKDVFVSLTYIFKNKIRPKLEYLKNIVKVGYGIFFEQLLMRVGFMATAVMAAKQGTNAMAAHQVCMNLCGLSFSFGDGLQAAAVALIGRSLGENNPELAKMYGKKCQNVGGIISVVVSVLYFFGAKLIMRAFFDENEIVNIGIYLMYIVLVTILFQIRQVIYMGCLRGAGDTLYTAVVSAISVTFIRTVFSYVFCYGFNMGIYGVWFGILSDQVIRFICASIRFKLGKWVTLKI